MRGIDRTVCWYSHSEAQYCGAALLEAEVCADALRDTAPGLAAADRLRHALALHKRDYLEALETLHRSSDCRAGGPKASEGGEADVGRFQSSLLSLAALHAHFGHTQARLFATESHRPSTPNHIQVNCYACRAALLYLRVNLVDPAQ